MDIFASYVCRKELKSDNIQENIVLLSTMVSGKIFQVKPW